MYFFYFLYDFKMMDCSMNTFEFFLYSFLLILWSYLFYYMFIYFIITFSHFLSFFILLLHLFILFIYFKVLDESIAFLEGELLKRGVITEEGVRKLKKEALEDMSDLDNSNLKAGIPENYSNGNWKMKPSLMD